MLKKVKTIAAIKTSKGVICTNYLETPGKAPDAERIYNSLVELIGVEGFDNFVNQAKENDDEINVVVSDDALGKVYVNGDFNLYDDPAECIRMAIKVASEKFEQVQAQECNCESCGNNEECYEA